MLKENLGLNICLMFWVEYSQKAMKMCWKLKFCEQNFRIIFNYPVIDDFSLHVPLKYLVKISVFHSLVFKGEGYFSFYFATLYNSKLDRNSIFDTVVIMKIKWLLF